MMFGRKAVQFVPRVKRQVALRWFGVLCMLLFGLLTGIQATSAHANLVRSEPPANGVLSTAPAQVRLWFSETPEPAFSTIQLLDRDGRDVEGRGSIQVDPNDPKLLSVTLPSLPNGIYTVVWHTLSAVDGHVTAGSFSFVVGTDQGNTAFKAQTETQSAPSIPAVLVRALLYLGLALLLGGFAFVPLIFQPLLTRLIRQKSSQIKLPPANRSFSHESGLFRLLWVSTMLLILVTLADAVLQSGRVGGTLVALLTATRYGLLFWGRIAVLILVMIVLGFRQSRWWRSEVTVWWWRTGILLSSVLMLLISLNSHAAAHTIPIIPVVVDWLHMLAMGVWLGGLASLLLATRWLWNMGQSDSLAQSDAPGMGPLIAVLVNRFSQVATICVLLLSITGVAQVLFEVGEPLNFIDTQYGLTLLAKLSLLIPLLLLAAVNLLVIRRQMERAINQASTPNAPPNDSTVSNVRPMQHWTRMIQRTVAFEIVFIVGILTLTGLLTNLPPAKEAFGAGILLRGQQDDVRVIVAVNPGMIGLNTFDLYIKDNLNRPVANAEKVALLTTMADMDMGTAEAVASPVEDGHYVIQGNALSMTGNWHLQVLVRRSGRDDARIDLPVLVGNQPPSLAQTVTLVPSRLILAFEILLLAGLTLVASRRLQRVRRWAGLVAIVIGTIIGIGALSVGASAFTTDPFVQVINPVTADTASLARGKQTYEQNCVVCHGETGKGDGTLADSLKIRPANFQVHMTQGHSDGQIFDWITNGVNGSPMPAFGSRLSEQERWDVINYIRTFATTP